jgi:hypothetical protein
MARGVGRQAETERAGKVVRLSRNDPLRQQENVVPMLLILLADEIRISNPLHDLLAHPDRPYLSARNLFSIRIPTATLGRPNRSRYYPNTAARTHGPLQ